jgi:CubicO group peptidase (beta-lactamase class C family)
MRRSRLLWVILLIIAPVCILGFLFLTGERGFSRAPMAPRPLEITRLSAAETEHLGWKPAGLDAVFKYAASVSTDVMMITTDGQIVGAFGNLEKPYPLHSIRKAFLSALVGQHIGSGEKQIRLDATLGALGINDTPNPLTPLQKQATVLDLLKSMSGINHAAAAEEGLLSEKNRRLGTGDNKAGTIWAYNNWDYNALTTIFETRTGITIADSFQVGIAKPIGMLDYTPKAVSYISAPNVSLHRAAMFEMSARDLTRFGELYLNQGLFNGVRILPQAWIDRITADYAKTDEDSLSAGHGYLWWIPGPDTGLPKGSFWAKGIGPQALFVIPEWHTVIVHLSDMTAFFKRYLTLTEGEGLAPDAALEQVALSCLQPSERATEYCREHRFILRREFAELVSLIAKARR